jgi:hypothetical protein
MGMTNEQGAGMGVCIILVFFLALAILPVVTLSFVIIDYEIFRHVNITQNFICATTNIGYDDSLFGYYLPDYKSPYISNNMACVGECSPMPNDKYLSLKKRQENYYIYMICFIFLFVFYSFTTIIVTIPCLFHREVSKIYRIIIYTSMIITISLFIVIYIVDYELCDFGNLYIYIPSSDTCVMFCSSMYSKEVGGPSYCNNPINSGNITFILTGVIFCIFIVYHLVMLCFFTE